MTELRPVWQDIDHWRLRQLFEAHELVHRHGYTREQVSEMYEQAEQVDGWLCAEAAWKVNVERWLTAERAWKARQTLLDGDPAYAAAERGWLAMRAATPNLDGVPSFGALSEILQDRYALFAKAVLA